MWTNFSLSMHIISYLYSNLFFSIIHRFKIQLCWPDFFLLNPRLKKRLLLSLWRLVAGGVIDEDFPYLFDRIFPESLRWLLATQQYCRSKWIMGHIAKKNRVNMELDADNILTGNKYSERESGIRVLLCNHTNHINTVKMVTAHYTFAAGLLVEAPLLCPPLRLYLKVLHKPDWQGYISFLSSRHSNRPLWM